MGTSWSDHLEALMTRRYPALVARARVLGADAAMAEDIVQQALVSTFSRPRHLATLGEAEAYVKRVIVHEYLDLVTRRRSETQRWVSAHNGTASASADAAGQVDAKVDLASALAQLPPRERACVALRYLDDLDIQQTAAVLHLSTGSVKRYVHDGLTHLNAALGTNASEVDALGAPVTAPRGGAR